jgi:hypothetical protein
MTNPKEIWKPVPGYEGVYEVSNYGRVRSLDRYRTIRGSLHKYKGKILKPYMYQKYTQGISLRDGSKKDYWTLPHLVLRVFGDYSGSSDKIIVVGYRDGDRTNLYIGNLYIAAERFKHDKSDYALWEINNNSWQVRMNIAGKFRYFGLYKTKEQAQNVRDTIREIYKETGKIVYPQKYSITTRRKAGSGSIYLDKKRNKWMARITENKKTHYFGVFPTKEEAEAVLDGYIAKKKKE